MFSLGDESLSELSDLESEHGVRPLPGGAGRGGPSPDAGMPIPRRRNAVLWTPAEAKLVFERALALEAIEAEAFGWGTSTAFGLAVSLGGADFASGELSGTQSTTEGEIGSAVSSMALDDREELRDLLMGRETPPAEDLENELNAPASGNAVKDGKLGNIQRTDGNIQTTIRTDQMQTLVHPVLEAAPAARLVLPTTL